MQKQFYKTKTTEENKRLVQLIDSRLSNFREKIKEMSEDEIKIEKPDEIVNIVKGILEFNIQNQEGQGLKILTPDQMLSRLPITLAQLKARDNSKKLKNEIRQLLYSLYRSKNYPKQFINIWLLLFKNGDNISGH